MLVISFLQIMLQTTNKIIITGAAGFIASQMALFLNEKGYENLILIDDFTPDSKLRNHESIKCIDKIDRNQIEAYLQSVRDIDYVIHFGARTDTTEMDYAIHQKLNYEYSKILWHYCTLKQIPMIYASSAATYGNGEFGYNDSHEIVEKLQPLNPYGVSKNEFDKFAVLQNDTPKHWYGLKFFNVYGPNEYHKGRMASVIFHAFHQIRNTGKIKLFKSHHPDFQDGEQLRDFIYVKDILAQTYWTLLNLPASGLYNAGTGKAETFNALAYAVFKSLNLEPTIEYIDTPLDIRDKYQYFTEANNTKLRGIGFAHNYYNLEKGVHDYIQHYLLKI